MNEKDEAEGSESTAARERAAGSESTEDVERDLTSEGLYALSRDLRKAAQTMGLHEVRFLVDQYYNLQKQRIRTTNQIRAMSEDREPHEVIEWFKSRSSMMEAAILAALDAFSKHNEDGKWLRSNYGVGPVIAAGLLAHLAFEVNAQRVTTVGQWWRFAGLDNPANYDWTKGKKRPWNARLKVLCWKLGESFKKFSNRDDCYYGNVYRDRKYFEVERNESGGNAECAARTLEQKKFKDKATKAIYESGKLPAGRLDLRATRYAVKLFLSHYFEWGYGNRWGEAPPLPYPVAHLGHVHRIKMPL